MTAADLMDAVLVASIARWSGDPTLLAFLGGPHIYADSVPEELEPARYVVVGEQTGLPFGTLERDGGNTTMATGAWTRGAPDRRDVLQIVKLMNDAVAEPFVLAGFGTVVVINELTTVIPDPDPALHHAPVRYRWEALES